MVVNPLGRGGSNSHGFALDGLLLKRQSSVRITQTLLYSYFRVSYASITTLTVTPKKPTSVAVPLIPPHVHFLSIQFVMRPLIILKMTLSVIMLLIFTREHAVIIDSKARYHITIKVFRSSKRLLWSNSKRILFRMSNSCARLPSSVDQTSLLLWIRQGSQIYLPYFWYSFNVFVISFCTYQGRKYLRSHSHFFTIIGYSC